MRLPPARPLAALLVGGAALAALVWLSLRANEDRRRTAEPVAQATPAAAVALRAEQQRRALAGLGAPPSPKQILFGDLHVHTTFSWDAFLMSLPVTMGEGAHPPADACDFARFCAGLDFWSINDHAEHLDEHEWRETIDAVRACNRAAGLAEDPDLVAFLGWEWTQAATFAAGHYGHKNVVLFDTERAQVPDAPIPATPGGAPTPQRLFAQLAAWGRPSLVIPHGSSWGVHAPPTATWDTQLGEHDPDRERLFEVYSGHGSSEVARAWRHAERGEAGALSCPPPNEEFEPCCWRAGELIRARCGAPGSAVCVRRVEKARRLFLAAGTDPRRFAVVPGASPEDWGECGQLQGGFLPAYTYRPGMSAQYALALAGTAGDGSPRRLRFGLIASSDTHRARAGSGYKEFARTAMTDTWGWSPDVLASVERPPAGPDPLRADTAPVGWAQLPERGAAFFYTGGLVAAHARGRGRAAVWEALERREVYGTSGDRILLWFDLLNGADGPQPMGSEAVLAVAPRFRVRAVGALEERPGCPAFVQEQLGAARLRRLCRGECHHPGDRRRRIARIEVVRIRVRRDPGEAVEPLVEDPWRSWSCEGDPAGCVVEFEDETFPEAGREIVYYVRALQERSAAVNGDPLRCRRDGQGRCIEPRPCYASGTSFDPDDDCLAPVQERAWSSPIFLRPPGS